MERHILSFTLSLYTCRSRGLLHKSFYHESNWILGNWVQFGIDSKVILWILIFYPMASIMTVLNAFVHVSWQKNLNNALQ